MPVYVKNIIILNTIAIVIFSITMIVKTVDVFSTSLDIRYGGVIFLATMWSYSIGLYYKNSKSNNKQSN